MKATSQAAANKYLKLGKEYLDSGQLAVLVTIMLRFKYSLKIKGVK